MKKKILSIIISGLILGLLFYSIKLESFTEVVKKIQWPWYILVFITQVIVYLFKAWRFQIMLEEIQGAPVKITPLFNIISAHNFLNHVLPARSGELSYIYLLKKNLRFESAKGIATLIIARIFDLMCISLLFIISAFAYIRLFSFSPWKLLGMNLGLLVVFAALLYYLDSILEKVLKLLKWVANRIKSKQELFERILTKGMEVLISFKGIKSRKMYFKILLLSLLIWFFSYFMFFLFMKAFDIKLSLLQVILATSLCQITLLLPINSVGNIGVWEAGWTAGYMLVGLNKDVAISLGICIHVLVVLGAGILALLGWRKLSGQTLV